MLSQGTLLIVLGLFMALNACSTMTVKTQHNPKAIFSAYKSYQWRPASDLSQEDPRIDHTRLAMRVHSAVNREMAAKGYREESIGQPDLYIGYHGIIQDKLDAWNLPSNYRSPGQRRVDQTPEVIVTEYMAGSLILDIVDARTERLVWRGYAEAGIDESDSDERREELINEAVRRMLKQFPPK